MNLAMESVKKMLASKSHITLVSVLITLINVIPRRGSRKKIEGGFICRPIQ